MTAERPTPLTEGVAARLSKVRRRDTKPELLLRSELHRRGLRFRVAVEGLPGSPDLAFSRAKLAVFVDGCFWHGCPEHYVAPKNNREWWERKLADNRSRDVRKDEALIALGWGVLHIWEHEDVEAAADTVQGSWQARTGR